MTRRSVMLSSFLGAAALTLAALGWGRVSQHRAVSAGVSDVPDLANFVPELQERVAKADAQARGYLRPQQGLRRLSRLYHANGFLDEAMVCYETLERLEPANAVWPHLHASILAGYGRGEDAYPLYLRASQLAPDYIPARLRAADVSLKANRLGDAERLYRDVLPRSRENPYAWLGLARCAIARDDWGKARDLLQHCVEVNPEFVGAMSLLATVQLHFGDTATANEIMRRVARREFVDLTDPWVEAVIEDCYDSYRLSVAAAVAGFRLDRGSAEQLLLRAISYSPRPAPFYRQLAMLYLGQDRPADARRNLEQAIALAPTDSDAWAYLVKILNDGGDRTGAYRTVLAGLEKCPESRALHAAYGRMLKEAGQLPEAIAQFREAKRLQPDESSSYVELASIFLQLQQEDDAVAELQGALAVLPDHPIALMVLARIAIAHGDRTKSVELLRAAERQPKILPEEVKALRDEFEQQFGSKP